MIVSLGLEGACQHYNDYNIELGQFNFKSAKYSGELNWG